MEGLGRRSIAVLRLMDDLQEKVGAKNENGKRKVNKGKTATMFSCFK